MSKPWFAFSKRAAACVAVSAVLAFGVLVGSAPARATSVPPPAAKAEDAPAPAESLPERAIAFSARGGQALRVGDTVSYALEPATAAEARWGIDPKRSGLKLGFLFRPGRLFTPLAAGELSLPALPILDEKGETVARTKPIAIRIESNFTGKERNSGQPPKAEPAIGPLGLPFPVWIQSAIAFALLGLVLVGAYFLVRYLRRKAAAALRKILPKKPYDVAALERMDSLLKREPSTRAEFKALYFGISETLKAYLGDRFEFDARESTTSELLGLLREHKGTPGLGDPVIRRVVDLFELLDPVKFADVVPSLEGAKAVHREARDLIASTRKAAVAPVGDAAAAGKGAR